MPPRRPAPSPPASARGGTVPAVARAARLLDTLAGTRRSLPLAELVRTLALPKSTVHGLCATLAQAGLVERLADGTYHLGTRVMDLAHVGVVEDSADDVGDGPPWHALLASVIGEGRGIRCGSRVWRLPGTGSRAG